MASQPTRATAALQAPPQPILPPVCKSTKAAIIYVADSGNRAVRVLSTLQPLALASALLSGATTGRPYAVALPASGGVLPYSLSALFRRTPSRTRTQQHRTNHRHAIHAGKLPLHRDPPRRRLVERRAVFLHQGRRSSHFCYRPAVIRHGHHRRRLPAGPHRIRRYAPVCLVGISGTVPPGL